MFIVTCLLTILAIVGDCVYVRVCGLKGESLEHIDTSPPFSIVVTIIGCVTLYTTGNWPRYVIRLV